MNSDDKIVLCECNNCSWQGDVSECNEIHGLLDRVSVGDEFPAGECPICEALTYLVRKATPFIRSWFSVGETLPDESTQTIDTFDTLQEALHFIVKLNSPGFIDRWQSATATPADSIDEVDEAFTPIHFPF